MRILRWMILAIGMIGGAVALSTTAGSAPLPASAVVGGIDSGLLSEVRGRGRGHFRGRHFGRRHFGRHFGWRRHHWRRHYGWRRGLHRGWHHRRWRWR